MPLGPTFTAGVNGRLMNFLWCRKPEKQFKKGGTHAFLAADAAITAMISAYQ